MFSVETYLVYFSMISLTGMIHLMFEKNVLDLHPITQKVVVLCSSQAVDYFTAAIIIIMDI